MKQTEAKDRTMPDTMTRWEAPSFGLSNLKLATVQRPTPKAGEIGVWGVTLRIIWHNFLRAFWHSWLTIPTQWTYTSGAA
jgi:hypothetical protein